MRKLMFLSLASMVILSSCTEETKVSRMNPSTQETQVTVSSVCGDGRISSEEVCEGNFFVVSKFCSDYGYSDGFVKCSSSCLLDFSDCVVSTDNKPVIEQVTEPICGNGVKEGDEECDSNIFLGSCDNFGDYNKGDAYCIQCKVDLSLCSKEVAPVETPKEESKSVCGNGIKEEGEECDTIPQEDNELLCAFFGDFNQGKAYCKSCKIDLSLCSKETDVEESTSVCGNGVKEEGEECDDGNNSNLDLCTNICTIPKCRDGILTKGEECDGVEYSKRTCKEYNPNFDTGYLTCTSSCKIDATACITTPKCGDGIVNTSSEECDGSVGSHTCNDIYNNATGSVVCAACHLDYSGCKEVCPTNRQFIDGQYTYQTNYFIKHTNNGNTYLILGNKTGLVIDSTTVLWIYSSLGDEGYYSYFKQVSCDCNSCTISYDGTSYLNKSDVKPASSGKFIYAPSPISDVPTSKVPSIAIPEFLRTGDMQYNSCNYHGCSDADYYSFSSTDSKMIVSTEPTSKWEFSFIKDLGDNTYLVHFDTGYGLPKDLQINGITNPYAVLHITKSDRYTVCDYDDNHDITVQVLSWSEYRDTAIAKADFNSTDTFTYKSVTKYSKDSCSHTVISEDSQNQNVIFLSEKFNRGEDLYTIKNKLIDIKRNLCQDWNIVGKYNNTWEKVEDFLGDFYISTYRPSVIVLDPIKKYKETFYTKYPLRDYSGTVSYTNEDGVDYRFELEFSSVDFLNDFLTCTDSLGNMSCSFTLSNPHGHSSETINFCKVYLNGVRECKILALHNGTVENLPHEWWGLGCTKKYQ